MDVEILVVIGDVLVVFVTVLAELVAVTVEVVVFVLVVWLVGTGRSNSSRYGSPCGTEVESLPSPTNILFPITQKEIPSRA